MHSIARILSVLVLLASRTVLASPIIARTDAPTCLINGIKYTPAEAKDTMNSGKYDQATNAAFRDCCDKNQPAANADSNRMGPNQFNAVPNPEANAQKPGQPSTTSPLDGAKKGEHVDANAEEPTKSSNTFPLDGTKKGEQVDANAEEPTKSSNTFPLDPANKGTKLKDENAKVQEDPNGDFSADQHGSTPATEQVDVNSPKNAKDGKLGQQSQGAPAAGADVENGLLHNAQGTNQNPPSVMDMQLTHPSSENAQVGQSNKPATSAKANGAAPSTNDQVDASESGPAGESGNADVQRKGPTPSAQTQPMMDVKMASPLSFSEGAKGDEHTGTPAVSTPKEGAQVNESNASGKSTSGDKNAKATDKNAKVDASESGLAAENETLSTNGPTSQGEGTSKEGAEVTQSNSPGNENAKATASTDKNASEDPAASADPEENVNVDSTGAHRQEPTDPATSANPNQGKGSEENAKLEGGEPSSAGTLSNLEGQLGGEKAAAKKAAAANEQTCTCPQ